MLCMDSRKLERLYEALLRLRHGPEFEPVRVWLREQWEAEHVRLEKEVSREMLFRAQGRAQVLSELMDQIEQAPSRLEKVRSTK